MQPVIILELVPEQTMLPRCICQGCHDALHASTEKPFLYKFILEATRDQHEHRLLLHLNAHREQSDADVFYILNWAAIAETSGLRHGLRSGRICACQHPYKDCEDTSI